MTFTYTLTATEEEALNDWLAYVNAKLPPATPTTAVRELERATRTWLRLLAKRFEGKDRDRFREAFKAATPSEKAQVNAILNLY